MRAAIAVALLVSLAVPQAVFARSMATVNVVNESDREVGLQISGSAVTVGGQRHLVLKPRHFLRVPVAPGDQQLRVWTIRRGTGMGSASGASPGFDRAVAIQPGSVIRITEQDFPAGPTTSTAQAGDLTYEGYSRHFVPLKQSLLRDGDAEIRRVYAERDKKINEACEGKLECYVVRAGFLGLAEKGTLSLDLGEFDQCVDDLRNAEMVLTLADNESKVKEWLKKGGSIVLETLTGHEEIGPYYGEGFERVLMLNYKSIAYLLKGDRKAYNVARRAIDWQNMERRRFEDKLKEVEDKLREKETEKGKDGDQSSQVRDASSQVREVYAKTDAKASTVASAYVNPFGFYLAGVIQELEGQQDPSLVSNALISYRKALELNPGSQAIQEAVGELEQAGRKPPEGRLIHVIVNDGFAPEKMVKTQYFNAGPSRRTGRPILVPIKLPYYQPVSNKVQRIAVETTDGRKLAELSPVADVEAIALRHQKDLQAFLITRVVLATLRNTFWAAVADSGAIGEVVGKIMMHVAAPDTRAWMTLPSSMQAGRAQVPPGINEIVIATYDGSGTRLASRAATLHESGATFVYGRSLDDKLVVHASRDVWVNAKGPRETVMSR